MTKPLKLLVVMTAFMGFLSFDAFAQNPSFKSFNPQQFSTNGFVISILPNAITNGGTFIITNLFVTNITAGSITISNFPVTTIENFYTNQFNTNQFGTDGVVKIKTGVSPFIPYWNTNGWLGDSALQADSTNSVGVNTVNATNINAFNLDFLTPTATNQLSTDSSNPTWNGHPINLLVDPRTPPFNAKCDGIADDYAALTNALAASISNHGALLIPQGITLISKTITVPTGSTIVGMAPVDLTYRGYPGGLSLSVLKTSGAFTALQTPRLTFPNDTLAFWASDITLENFYVNGPYSQATAAPGIVGIDFTGIRNSRLRNIHAEGFGTGVLIKNCSEMDVSGTIAQNNYYGLIAARTPFNGNTYDCLAHFYSTYAYNNTVDIRLDNPRSVWFYGAEAINNLTNAIAHVDIINCEQDSQITFDGVIFENQSSLFPRITWDDNGFGVMRLLSCNNAVDLNQPIVKGPGYFDTLEITGNQFERGIVTNNHAPIIWITTTAATNNQYLRHNRVILKNNTPAWYDTFVRNDQVGARPENDFVPDGYVNLNPFPNCDHANDGTIQAAGSINYYTGNPMCGTSRIWWDTTTTNNFYELNTLTNLTRGIDHIYVTCVVYDLNGTKPPSIAVAGWGVQDVGWKISSQGRIGSYTNASGDVFGKWAWCITSEDPSVATNGLVQVQLGSIYSPGGVNATNTGLERFCVYAPVQKNPYGPRKLTHAAIPSTGLEGWHYPGDFYYNDMTNPVLTNVLGWVCVKYGLPGIWDTVPLGSTFNASLYKVLIDSADTGATYLGGKLVPGSNVTFVTNNIGGVEQITISAASAGGSGPTNLNFIAPLSISGGSNVMILPNGIDDSLLRQGNGNSVIGRSSGAAGNVSDITATGDGQVLSTSGGTLAFFPFPAQSTNFDSIVVTNAVLNPALPNTGMFTSGAFTIFKVNNNNIAVVGSSRFGLPYFDADTGLTIRDASGNLVSRDGGTGIGALIGSGSPNGAVTLPPGSLFLNSAGGPATTLYVKESGAGNTGWVGVGGTVPGAQSGELIITSTADTDFIGANPVATTYAVVTVGGTNLSVTLPATGTYQVMASVGVMGNNIFKDWFKFRNTTAGADVSPEFQGSVRASTSQSYRLTLQKLITVTGANVITIYGKSEDATYGDRFLTDTSWISYVRIN